MLVAEAVGRALAAEGVAACFGVLGSGNLVFTNALRDAGVPFVAARHEGGAICMADGYARASGELAACSVHQGPGLTNAITGLNEVAEASGVAAPGPQLAPPRPADAAVAAVAELLARAERPAIVAGRGAVLA